MFRGANKVTLDAKGRLAMPTRYRERIVERSNGRLIATVDRAEERDAALGVVRRQRDPALLPRRPRLARTVGGRRPADLPPRPQGRLVVGVELLDVDHAATVVALGGDRHAVI